MSRSPARLRALLTAASVATAPVLVHAAEPPSDRVGVIPVQFDGTQGEAWEGQMKEALMRGLVEGGLDVVPPETVAQKSGVEQCENARCLGFMATSVDARYLVRSEVTFKDKNYAFSLDVLEGSTGELVATSQESCELCGAAEATELLTKQAAGIRSKIETMVLGPATFSFVSEPAGAQVRIDGRLVGTTPLEYQLEPGQHEAELTLAGHLPVRRKLSAVRGLDEKVTVSLQEVPDEVDPAQDAKKRKMTIAGATLTGVGAGALAAGVAFLVLDGRSYQSRCSGADVDAFGNCRQRYDTLVHGAVSTAVAGAALISGVVLLVVGRKNGSDAKKTREKRKATARIGVGFSGVTVSGRF